MGSPDQDRRAPVERRRFALAASAIIASFTIVDPWFDVSQPLLVFSMRVVWVGSLVLSIVRVPPGLPPWVRRVLEIQHGPITGIAFSSIVSAAGGTSHPYFDIGLALPLALGVLDPKRPSVVTLCGLAIGVGCGWRMLEEGVPMPTLANWLLLLALCTAFAFYSIVLYGRMHARELEAVRALAAKERAEVHLARLATIGRLSAGVAHEINNPLTIISANADFLRMRAEARRAAGARECFDANALISLEELLAATERIVSIVGDLKRFARSEADPLTAVDVQSVVASAVRLASMQVPRTTRIVAEMPSEPLLCRAAPRQLSQVLVNLIVNAADAIETAGRRDGCIGLSAESSEDAVRVRVVDNGTGLAPEVMANLFEPFFTTKTAGEGLGLGLALSREFLARMSARIEGANASDGGAEFVVTLERVHDEATAEA